jgi:DNA-binding IclR family transcriptional regulator
LIENKKLRVLKELEKVNPNDLSIGEVAKKTKLSRTTVSTYLKVLHAEGKIEVSREVGRAIFYRTRRKAGLKEE